MPRIDVLKLLGDDHQRVLERIEVELRQPHQLQVLPEKPTLVAIIEQLMVVLQRKVDGEDATVARAAAALFDNRLGWSEGRAPYAPLKAWADLGAALHGEADVRVVELRAEQERAPTLLPEDWPSYADLVAELSRFRSAPGVAPLLERIERLPGRKP